MITFWQYLKEIHDSEIKKISRSLNDFEIGKYNSDVEYIFGNKKRLSFPIVDNSDKYIVNFIERLKSHGINLTIEELRAGEILVKKEVNPEFISFGQENSYNKYKISTYMRKFLRGKKDEEEIMDQFGLVIDKVKKFDYTNNYSVVVSRHPIDMLRMSDHFDDNKNQIRSCHSYAGTHYNCAITESNIGSIIAYAVKTNDLEEVDLQANEIFRDKDRGVKGTIKSDSAGIFPVERLRFRRFYNHKKKITIFVPELKTYPLRDEKENPILIIPGFRDAVVKWAKDSQKYFIEKIDPKDDYDDFRIIGSTYQDSNSYETWNDFFNVNVIGNKKPIDYYDDGSVETLNNELKKIVSDELDYFSNKDLKLNYNERGIYSYLDSVIKINFKKENILKIPTKEELIQDSPNSILNLLKSKNSFFDLSKLIYDIEINDLGKEISIILKLMGPDTENEKDVHEFYEFVELIKKINYNSDYIFYIFNLWMYKNDYVKDYIEDYHEFKSTRSFINKVKETSKKELKYIYSRDVHLFFDETIISLGINFLIYISISDHILEKAPTEEEIIHNFSNSFFDMIKSKNEFSDLINLKYKFKLNYHYNNIKLIITFLGPNTKENKKDLVEYIEFIEIFKKIKDEYNYFSNFFYYWLNENNYLKNYMQKYSEKTKKLNHFKLIKNSGHEYYNSSTSLLHSHEKDIIDNNNNNNNFKFVSEWFEVGDLKDITGTKIHFIFYLYKNEFYLSNNSFNYIKKELNNSINPYETGIFNGSSLIFKFNHSFSSNNYIVIDQKDKLYAKFNFLFPYFVNNDETEMKVRLIEEIDQNFEKYVKIVKDWWQTLKKS